MNFIMSYFEKFHVHMVGACWNKLPPMHSYHSYEQCKHYVTKYFKETRNGVISTYGHIPLVQLKVSHTQRHMQECEHQQAACVASKAACCEV